MTVFDFNYLYFSPLLILFMAVFVFCVGWFPAYLVIRLIITFVTSFFRQGKSRNMLKL